MKPGKRFGLIFVPLAFVAFILLINTNSYFVDKYKLNTVYLIAGIVVGLAAIWQLIIVIKGAGGPPERK